MFQENFQFWRVEYMTIQLINLSMKEIRWRKLNQIDNKEITSKQLPTNDHYHQLQPKNGQNLK